MADPATRRAMDVERSSLCNCVVNFLLQENYLLTAFELFHELLEDGRHDQAIRLRDFFADPALFPPDQISRISALRVADPQSMLEEKVMVEEKLAISEYELRLAQEDLSRMKEELQKQKQHSAEELKVSSSDLAEVDGPTKQLNKREVTYSLGPLKDTERKDLNCAVKEYLLFSGYRLTAMTFLEEVTDQNLDVWPNSSASVSDALRRYYYQYLSSTSEAAEERISLIQENEELLKDNRRLCDEKESMRRSKELIDNQILSLRKSLEIAQKELKDKEILVQDLKQSMDLQRKQLNDCRAEITALKMHIEGARASRGWTSGESENTKTCYADNSKEEKKSSYSEPEELKGVDSGTRNQEAAFSPSEDVQAEEKVVEINQVAVVSKSVGSVSANPDENHGYQATGDVISKHNNVISDLSVVSCNGSMECQENVHNHISELQSDNKGLNQNSGSLKREKTSEKMAMETIQILSDALPKIVPYVLINHREELLPLIMCAIERHPDSTVRDSLTHTLFNLIKRPDEQQRRIIMDACVTLAKNVGEMRTETELLPQCWEQINHKYEERRLLVAQSCGELAEFVQPEIRDSLILSIIQQLIEDSATVVREAAAHNLALLLPLFPNLDKYFKVEELMFQLVCDPSGAVVDTTIKKLVPAVINWGGKLDHVLRVILSHILGSAQRCPPLSGVESSLDSHVRVLGERERWNIDVLLRMLKGLLPFVHQKAIETCPFNPPMESLAVSEEQTSFFSVSLLQLYAEGNVMWPMFDWMHTDCLPDLIQLSCLLSHKEDKLRTRITKYLLEVYEFFGEQYLTLIILPVFLVAVGDIDTADLTFFPSTVISRVKALRPKTPVAQRLSAMCILPLLLSGILGASANHEKLPDYLRKLLVQNNTDEGPWFVQCNAEVIDAVRFLCIFEEHHGVIFNILWEMVVSANVNMKTNAAVLLKVLVPYIDVKVASIHVLPALITLGSDPNVNVKYASIEAFGAVAQHFKSDVVVDKIRVQMDAFLEDGSHEATITVVRALLVAVPHTTDRLREYLLSKIFQLSSVPSHGNDITHRREKANVFCEAIRALDATDLSANSVRDFLVPTIQNLLKDLDALDPAHKEALEIILKERSGGAFESISKVMGSHLGIASSVSSLFGDGGLLGKKEGSDLHEPAPPPPPPQPSPSAAPEDTRFRRMMRGSFSEILRGKGKGYEEPPRQSG